MFFHSMSLFLHSNAMLRGRRLPYVILGAVSLALTSIVVLTNAVFMEFMWIDHRDFPGGPLGFLAANSAIWWQTLSTTANILVNFLGDGLMLYRCYIIWQGRWSIIAFPILLYLGSISMAIALLVQSALPGSDFFKGKTVNFGIPWAALSVSLNVIVTSLIIYRLLKVRRDLREAFSKAALRMYTGISAILVESALPFSLLGIAFAITYGKNYDEGPAFLFAWGSFSALSPQFIIFRVTGGKSWTEDIVTQSSVRSGININPSATMFSSESIELSQKIRSKDMTFLEPESTLTEASIP
ncbi:hypothetical protein BDQ12DRAFT_611822 [Crucibulum laeve]|uniref:Uncharacterized protein n=1 Tax=Crucibulum laeve TaxID=68775 RepID=A0A5C3LQR1_9AGAR|nr:hypothetical protein BDQ12DRAFT_611822 [Crucibulum laeve]